MSDTLTAPHVADSTIVPRPCLSENAREPFLFPLSSKGCHFPACIALGAFAQASKFLNIRRVDVAETLWSSRDTLTQQLQLMHSQWALLCGGKGVTRSDCLGGVHCPLATFRSPTLTPVRQGLQKRQGSVHQGMINLQDMRNVFIDTLPFEFTRRPILKYVVDFGGGMIIPPRATARSK